MLGWKKQRGKGWKPPTRTVSEFRTGSSHGWDSRLEKVVEARAEGVGPRPEGWNRQVLQRLTVNGNKHRGSQSRPEGQGQEPELATNATSRSLWNHSLKFNFKFFLVFSTGHFFFAFT